MCRKDLRMDETKRDPRPNKNTIVVSVPFRSFAGVALGVEKLLLYEGGVENLKTKTSWKT